MPGSGVEDSEIVGRICDVKGFGEVHEELTKFNNANREFSLLVTKGLPFFVKYSRFSSRVKPVADNLCRYEVEQEMKISWFPGALLFPMMNNKLKKTIDEVLEDLKVEAENFNHEQVVA